MKKLLRSLLFLTCFIMLVTATGCSPKYSYWQITKREANTDTEGEVDVVINTLQVTLSSSDIAQIWLNISGVKEDSITVGYSFGSTGKVTDKIVTKDFLTNSKGWYAIDVSSSYKVLKLTFVDTMRVNEIYFVKKDGKLLEFDFDSYFYRPSKSTSAKNTYTEAQLKKLGEPHSALCAFDEQDDFDFETAKKLFDGALEKEAENVENEDSSEE